MPTDFNTTEINIIDPHTGRLYKLGKALDLDITPCVDDTSELPDFSCTRAEEFCCELRLDNDSYRMLLRLSGSKLASNNWRKLHKIPMWRK